jgi:Ca2+-binding RTX toxin-like protein
MKLARLAALALAVCTAPFLPAASVGAPRCHGHVATIVGSSGADVIHGTSGNDVIDALGGSDRILGGRGDDVICGGPGSDQIDGGPGDDLVDGGTGSADRLLGGPGNDLIRSFADSVVLVGGAGDDRLVNLTAYATLHAESGRDTFVNRAHQAVRLYYRYSPVGVHVNATTGRVEAVGTMLLHLGPALEVLVVGSPYDDLLIGTAGDDRIQGERGNDVIRGRAGNDSLNGGGAKNRLYGGPGNDAFNFLRTGATVAHGGAGNDSMDPATSKDAVLGGLGDDFVQLTVGPRNGPRVGLGPGANSLLVRVAPPSPTTAWRHVAVDLGSGVIAADGRMTYFSGVVSSFAAYEDYGAPPVGSWEVDGTDAPEQVTVRTTSPSPVVLRGYGGDDTLISSTGDDTLDGGSGTDRGWAQSGNDSCISIELGVGRHSTGCERSTP